MSTNEIEVERNSKVFWFACVDIKVLTDRELSPIDKVVYSVLCVHVGTQNRKCNLRVKTIAEEAGCSVRSVQNSLNTLVERGIIERKERFLEGSQVSSRYQVIGYLASCYVEERADDSCEDEGGKSCDTPRTKCTPPVQETTPHNNDNSFNDIKDSLTREAELPNFTDMPLVFENQKPVIPEETKPLSSTNTNPEEVCTPDDAPDIMKSTAEYLLLKTGRTKLTWDEISDLRILAASHYPSRVQKEIDTACERFTRKGRALRTLTFGYIAGSLQHQQTRSPIGRAVRKAKPSKVHQELAPSTQTFTEDEIAALEAEIQGRGKLA